MKTLAKLLIFLIPVLLVGCRNEENNYEEKIENIVRVFWHEGTKYSVAIQNDNSSLVAIDSLGDGCWTRDDRGKFSEPIIKLVTDIEPDKKMWAKVRWQRDKWGCTGFNYLEIHLHSAKDIEGGDWNHGKFGSGQTHVVQ